MNNDIAVYPTSEERLHDLYSADCPCHPKIEVIGATLLIVHNKLVIGDLPKLEHVNSICKN